MLPIPETVLFKKTNCGYKLKELEAQRKFTIRIEKEITINDIENILISAFEGISTSWMALDEKAAKTSYKPAQMPLSQWLVESLVLGKEVILHPLTDYDETWILTLDKFLHGIKLNIINRSFDCDLEKMDPITADCILQYALFNEIIYA